MKHAHVDLKAGIHEIPPIIYIPYARTELRIVGAGLSRELDHRVIFIRLELHPLE